MNGVTIPPMPTLPNPEMFSKQELVKQYKNLEEMAHQQNLTLQELSLSLARICGTDNVLSSHLYELVDAFDAGSEAQINDHLRMLSEQRKQYKTQKEKVH